MPSSKTVGSEHSMTCSSDMPSNEKGASRLHIPELHILLVALFVLAALVGYQGTAHAAASLPLDYNCGPGIPTQQNPHCYYIARWNGAPGAFTKIFTNEIYAGSDWPNDDFVTNEMWLGDGGNSWVEVGLEFDAFTYSASEIMFWADQRPGANFYAHPGNTLQSGDFGKYGSFEILQTAKNTYHIAGYGLGTSISGTSTNNSMPLNDITIGGEVDGSSGASAPKNGYIDNMWYNSGSWDYQNNSGILSGKTGGSPNPWQSYSNGGWVSSPNGANNNGGHFQTCLPGFSNGC